MLPQRTKCLPRTKGLPTEEKATPNRRMIKRWVGLLFVTVLRTVGEEIVADQSCSASIVEDHAPLSPPFLPERLAFLDRCAAGHMPYG